MKVWFLQPVKTCYNRYNLRIFLQQFVLLVQLPRGKTHLNLAKSNCPNPPQPSDDLVKEGVGGAGLAEQSKFQ